MIEANLNVHTLTERIKMLEKVSISKIIRTVCKVRDVNQAKLLTISRVSNLVQARQLCFYMTRKYTNHSFESISRLFVKDDNTTYNHATIIHSIKHVEALRETEKSYDIQCVIIEHLIEDKISLEKWELLKDKEAVIDNLIDIITEETELIDAILDELGDEYVPRVEMLQEFLKAKICHYTLKIAEIKHKQWKQQ